MRFGMGCKARQSAPIRALHARDEIMNRFSEDEA